MKLSKLLLTSLIVPSTVLVPTLVTSCKNDNIPFTADAPTKYFIVKEKTFIIPVTFSYSPAKDIKINLTDAGDDLTLVKDSIKITNNKANIEFKISGNLSASKEFKFKINFFSSDLSISATIEDLDVIYEYQPPEKDITVKLVSPSSVETTESSCIYQIEFSKEPIDPDRKVGTNVINIEGSLNRTLTWASTQIVQRTESGKCCLDFKISIYSEFRDVYFFNTFDLELTFTNTFGDVQVETIPNCIFTHNVE